MYVYGTGSQNHLITGSELLQKVAHRAMEIANQRHAFCPDFSIIEVFRTAEQQFERYKVGREYNGSEWVKSGLEDVITYCDGYSDESYHQSGDALDFCAWIDGKANFEPSNLSIIATCFMQAAVDLGVEFEWGGHYKSFFDGGHFNLVRTNKRVMA